MAGLLHHGLERAAGRFGSRAFLRAGDREWSFGELDGCANAFARHLAECRVSAGDRWALETESERYAKRLASSMEENQALYDAVFPRLEDAMRHLDALPLDALPDDAKRLLWLCYSLVNASFPVEVWRQARVPIVGPRAWTSSSNPRCRRRPRAEFSAAAVPLVTLRKTTLSPAAQ